MVDHSNESPHTPHVPPVLQSGDRVMGPTCSKGDPMASLTKPATAPVSYDDNAMALQPQGKVRCLENPPDATACVDG